MDVMGGNVLRTDYGRFRKPISIDNLFNETGCFWQAWQYDCCFFLTKSRMGGELDYVGVDDEVIFSYFPSEGEAGESAATGEGDIDLAVAEGGAVEVDVDSVEGEALGFVDGDGPSEFEWILGETADGFGGDLVAGSIPGVAAFFPDFAFDFDDFVIGIEFDSD